MVKKTNEISKCFKVCEPFEDKILTGVDGN